MARGWVLDKGLQHHQAAIRIHPVVQQFVPILCSVNGFGYPVLAVSDHANFRMQQIAVSALL